MMKAGKYFVGDLCYVLHDRWDEFCALTCSGHNVLDGEFNFADGTRFATFTTKWGDGVYYDEQGNEYPVDAGLIGCVAIEDIKPHAGNFTDSGRIVEFVSDFSTWSDGGEIRIGNILINTDDDGVEDEEDEYHTIED